MPKPGAPRGRAGVAATRRVARPCTSRRASRRSTQKRSALAQGLRTSDERRASTPRSTSPAIADRTGNHAANVELAKRRAAAVRDALIAEGIAADRVHLKAAGRTSPAAAATTRPGASTRRRQVERAQRMFSRFFIERPIFAAVVSIILVPRRAASRWSCSRSQQYPTITPVQVTVSATYPGADSKTLADSVASPIEAQINGVDNMLYMSSTSSANRPADADGLLLARNQSRHRAGAGAEPRQPRAAAAADRGHAARACRCRRNRRRS